MPLIPTPRRDLLAAGISADRLDAEIRARRSLAIFRGVHVDTGAATSWWVRIRAAAATQDPLAVVGMQSAAVALRFRWLPPEWSALDAVVHLGVAQTDARRHRDGIRLHRRAIAPVDRVVINGVACMSATRTLVELARDPVLAPLLVVQIIDGALRDNRTSKDALFACLARFPGERGVARARGLIRRSREGVDSPQETRMRLMLEDGGITCLDVDMRIHDDDGVLLARGDLGVRRLLIWGEYDGFDPHTERATFRSDRSGDRWLHRRGWHVMRFADADLARPVRTCQEWLAAIADAPARIAALEPSRSPEVAAARRQLGFD